MYILFSGRASCSSRDVRRAVVYRHKNVLARARRSELARPKNEVSRFCYETWCVAYRRGASLREEFGVVLSHFVLSNSSDIVSGWVYACSGWRLNTYAQVGPQDIVLHNGRVLHIQYLRSCVLGNQKTGFRCQHVASCDVLFTYLHFFPWEVRTCWNACIIYVLIAQQVGLWQLEWCDIAEHGVWLR